MIKPKKTTIQKMCFASLLTLFYVGLSPATTVTAAAADSSAEIVQTTDGTATEVFPAEVNSFTDGYKTYIYKGETILPTTIDKKQYFFLPSAAELPDLDETGCIVGTQIHVMRSANVDSLFFYSSNPQTEGRDFVEKTKKNSTSGFITFKNAKGDNIYHGDVSQIKGRGNSTWACEKKPYQIKLKEAVDLCQTGKKENASKTWVLLTDAYDATLIHNLITYKFAAAMGLGAPDCKPIDLYYDGQYRGSYLLSEKVEVGPGRVNIKEQGYLLELDNAYYADEDFWVKDSLDNAFVVKSPDPCSSEELAYIGDYMQAAVDAALNGGKHPVTGKSVWKYIDKESLAKYYLLQEMCKNADAFCSSTYFYLPGDGSPLKAGPVWDFDDSYGVRSDMMDPNGLRTEGGWMSAFLGLPEFRQAVRKTYVNQFSASINQLVDGENAKGFWTLSYATNFTDASAAMDHVLWGHLKQEYLAFPTRVENTTYCHDFLKLRKAWMDATFSNWK